MQPIFVCGHELPFNSTALRKAEIVCNFGLSECSRVKKGLTILICRLWH